MTHEQILAAILQLHNECRRWLSQPHTEQSCNTSQETLALCYALSVLLRAAEQTDRLTNVEGPARSFGSWALV